MGIKKYMHGGNHHESANYGLSSVYNKNRYSKKAQSYRRFKKGGQVLDVYSSKGEKKGKGVNGRELYNGPYKDMTLKDFWDWDTMDYKKNSEGISFKHDPEYKNWRSKDRGYSGDELLNWYMYTQVNSEGTDVTNRSEWEGQNFGHVRIMDRVSVSDDPSEDVMIRKENGMPYFKAYDKDIHEHLLNRKNANDPEASWYPSSQSEAFGMAKDLGLNHFFYEGKPVSTQTKEDVQKLQNEYKKNVIGLRAIELYDKIVQGFNDHTYTNFWQDEDKYKDNSDLKTYINSVLKEGYTHTDDRGNSITISGKDMQDYRKSYQDKTGVDIYDNLTSYYDNRVKMNDPHYLRSLQLLNNISLSNAQINQKEEEVSNEPDFREKVDNTYVNMPNINIATEDKGQMGFVINGKWYPKGTQVLSEDESTPRQRKRKQQVYDDREKKKKYADLIKYNTNYSLGLSRSDQNHAMIDKLANSNMTYNEFKNHIDNTMPSLNGAVEFGLLGYGAAASYNIPLKIGKHFKNAKALSKLGNVSKIASRPLSYGDASNFAYATIGTIGYTPQIIEDVKEGNTTGAIGNTLGLGLTYVGVPSSFKNFNRQLDLGFKQYNRFPTTAQGFQTAFPNTSRAHSLSNNSQFNAAYDNMIGPTIGSSPRFNLFGPSQNDLLRKAKTYDKSLINAPSQSTINKLRRQ
tara:strand:- start:9028 stop:11079 length:2052 start_codon:yes stop_codon:yes gene_type:complete